MSRRRTTVEPTGRLHRGTVGRLTRRLGLAVVVATVPVVVGLAAGLLADAGSLGATVTMVVMALTGPFGEQAGTVWLFHAATLGLAGGCWLVGAGLLVEGLFD